MIHPIPKETLAYDSVRVAVGVFAKILSMDAAVVATVALLSAVSLPGFIPPASGGLPCFGGCMPARTPCAVPCAADRSDRLDVDAGTQWRLPPTRLDVGDAGSGQPVQVVSPGTGPSPHAAPTRPVADRRPCHPGRSVVPAGCPRRARLSPAPPPACCGGGSARRHPGMERGSVGGLHP